MGIGRLLETWSTVIEETTKSYAKIITARNFTVRSRSDTYHNCLLNSNLLGFVFVWAQIINEWADYERLIQGF